MCTTCPTCGAIQYCGYAAHSGEECENPPEGFHECYHCENYS